MEGKGVSVIIQFLYEKCLLWKKLQPPPPTMLYIQYTCTRWHDLFSSLNDREWNANEFFTCTISNSLKFTFMINAGKFHNHEFYFESDLSSKTLENISIMRSLSISRACFTLGGVFWRFRLSLTICPRDKRPCSSTVANTSRDFVTMVSWRAMATTVGSQKLYPGNCHSLCLSKEVRSMVQWNMAFEDFIFRMRFNQSFKKKTKYRTFYN